MTSCVLISLGERVGRSICQYTQLHNHKVNKFNLSVMIMSLPRPSQHYSDDLWSNFHDVAMAMYSFHKVHLDKIYSNNIK